LLAPQLDSSLMHPINSQSYFSTAKMVAFRQ